MISTTRDKINLKWNSILEEHMIEKCTILVDDTVDGKYLKGKFKDIFFNKQIALSMPVGRSGLPENPKAVNKTKQP